VDVYIHTFLTSALAAGVQKWENKKKKYGRMSERGGRVRDKAKMTVLACYLPP
jgi:hypothetical protein